jgi:hypothetical protein
LSSYLEASLDRLELWLRGWRTAVKVWKSTPVLYVKALRNVKKLKAVQFPGEPIQWVETFRYLGVTLDTQLIWPAWVNLVGKKIAHILGVVGPVLNRRSDLSVIKGVLLYKQLIRPMTDYVCPFWRSAARSHDRKLQVLQSNCLRIVPN